MKQPSPGNGVDWAEALRELGVVHRREQAALLRWAARLACASTPRGRLYVAASPCEDRSGWRPACLEEIALARADGVELHPLLWSLSRTTVPSWPKPSRLALASLELARTHAGVVDLARAWIAEGRLGAGIGILSDLLAEGTLAAERRDALEALALASEATGDADESLEWYEAAIGAQGSDVRVAVSMLSLALRHGDTARIEIAAERLRPLALSIPGARIRFRRALSRALSRASEDRKAFEGGRSNVGMDEVRRLALEGSGAEAELAQALIAN